MKKLFALTFIYALLISSAYADVAINAVNFPDEIFRTSVKQLDRNNDDVLSDAEIALIDTVNVSGRGVSSLQGIQYLTAMKTLYCGNNNLETLDVSSNTNLETLFCPYNKISAIDLTGCIRLRELYCYVNEIDALDLSNQPYLVSLDCQVNKLTNLDTSRNLMLEFLDCSNNPLTSLNVTGNTELKRLYCHDLSLSNGILDVSRNTKLTHLWCWNDGLTSINFPANVNLRSFRADDNDLSDISALYSRVSNPLELSVRNNDKITTSINFVMLSDFVLNGNTAVLDIGDYDNIRPASIAGYNASLEKLTFVSFDEGDLNGLRFSSQPEVVVYKYDTGIASLDMTAVAYRAGSGIKDRIATCFNGVFVGTENNGVSSWKGIPYAKAPVGSLRWKAPEAPDIDTTSVFNASEFAPASLQVDEVDQSESCLYLNVWKANTQDTSLKPIVVWIHGGSFKGGTPANPIYSGENFVAENKDIIFVSIAYRVGIMGFIDFSQVSGGENYPDSQNLSLLDMVQALKWIQVNALSFGGDPDRVTLMGQSSGSASISMLMTMADSKNLFKRAITESGALSMITRKADAPQLAQRLLEYTGKTNMAGLMSLTEDELKDAIAALDAYTLFPQPDGRILSEDLYKAFNERAGNFDMIIGSNADEINYWLLYMGQESFDQFAAYSFMAADAAISQYSSADAELAENFVGMTGNYVEFFNDLLFRGPAIAQAEAHTGKTYMYYWDYPVQLMEELGACHGAEVPYFLNTPDLTNMLVLNPDKNLQGEIQPVIANFIRAGNPSSGSFTWPEYNASSRSTVMFTEYGTISTTDDPLDLQREMITPLLKWGISGRELINGNLSSGISVDPDAAPTPDPNTNTDPAPTPTPNSRRIGSNTGGCDSGISAAGALMLLAFMAKRKNQR